MRGQFSGDNQVGVGNLMVDSDTALRDCITLRGNSCEGKNQFMRSMPRKRSGVGKKKQPIAKIKNTRFPASFLFVVIYKKTHHFL